MVASQNNSINYRTCGGGRKKAERITEEEGKKVTANLHNLNFGPGSPSVGVKLQRTFSLFCTCVLFLSLRVAVFFCLPRRSRSIFLVLLRIPLTLLSSAHLLLLLLRRRRGSRREGKKCRLRFPHQHKLSPSPFITLCFISQQKARERERATTYQSLPSIALCLTLITLASIIVFFYFFFFFLHYLRRSYYVRTR